MPDSGSPLNKGLSQKSPLTSQSELQSQSKSQLNSQSKSQLNLQSKSQSQLNSQSQFNSESKLQSQLNSQLNSQSKSQPPLRFHTGWPQPNKVQVQSGEISTKKVLPGLNKVGQDNSSPSLVVENPMLPPRANHPVKVEESE